MLLSKALPCRGRYLPLENSLVNRSALDTRRDLTSDFLLEITMPKELECYGKFARLNEIGNECKN